MSEIIMDSILAPELVAIGIGIMHFVRSCRVNEYFINILLLILCVNS